MPPLLLLRNELSMLNRPATPLPPPETVPLLPIVPLLSRPPSLHRTKARVKIVRIGDRWSHNLQLLGQSHRRANSNSRWDTSAIHRLPQAYGLLDLLRRHHHHHPTSKVQL